MKDIFDRDKPVFLVKINVGGLSRQRVAEELDDVTEGMSTDNANIWVLPIREGDSDITCIWDGNKSVGDIDDSMFDNIAESFLDDIKESSSFSEDQISELNFLLRKYRLNILLDGDK